MPLGELLGAVATVEFMLDPADAPSLSRIAGMGRAGRAVPITIEWHDTPDGALAADGLALAAAPGRWGLERLRADAAALPPGVVAEARQQDRLSHELPSDLAPLARFEGKRRRMPWSGEAGAVAVRLLDGRLSTRGRPPLCRLSLEGTGPALEALVEQLAQAVALSVPRATLPAQVLAAASGAGIEPRALGAPKVAADGPVTDSLAAILGHLLDVMLHWADRVPAAPDQEPVHQMRVAIRRLRSALSIFKHVAPCPQLEGVAAPLKLLATRLGEARDWDVFLDGTGARLAEAFPGDARCAAMLRAASRKRRAAYGELKAVLAGPEFRALAAALALAVVLRPWDRGEANEALRQDTTAFAAAVLARRAKRVRRDGRGIAELPVPALHELRKDCKRLRYTAEFFASLFPGKPTTRYLKRLSGLQEELGLLNDGAAISGLMAQLGRAERGYAAGLVEGFSMAQSGPARARIVAEWRRFRAADPFWNR